MYINKPVEDPPTVDVFTFHFNKVNTEKLLKVILNQINLIAGLCTTHLDHFDKAVAPTKEKYNRIMQEIDKDDLEGIIIPLLKYILGVTITITDSTEVIIYTVKIDKTIGYKNIEKLEIKQLLESLNKILGNSPLIIDLALIISIKNDKYDIWRRYLAKEAGLTDKRIHIEIPNGVCLYCGVLLHTICWTCGKETDKNKSDDICSCGKRTGNDHCLWCGKKTDNNKLFCCHDHKLLLKNKPEYEYLLKKQTGFSKKSMENRKINFNELKITDSDSSHVKDMKNANRAREKCLEYINANDLERNYCKHKECGINARKRRADLKNLSKNNILETLIIFKKIEDKLVSSDIKINYTQQIKDRTNF